MPHHRIASLSTILPSTSSVKNQPQKRKLSILDIIAGVRTPAQASTPFPLSASSDSPLSDNQNCRNIPTSKQRLQNVLLLARREVLEPFEGNPTAVNLKEELKTFLAAQRRMGLTSAEADELYQEIIVEIATENLKEFDVFGFFQDVLGIFFKSIDTITNILNVAFLFSTNGKMALIQGGALLFSFVLQFISSYVMGQPLWVGLLGMVGLKPVVEDLRQAINAKPFPNQKASNDRMLFISRIIEVIAEVFPQSLIQTLTIIIVPESRTLVPYFSLFSSLLTNGVLVSSLSWHSDAVRFSRKKDPLYYGYVISSAPPNAQMVASIAQVLFFATYAAAKISSLALLIASSSFRYAGVLLTSEFFGLLVLRKLCGNWRFYTARADGVSGVFISLAGHLGLYFSLLYAPFPIIRTPAFLTPRIYARGLLYMLVVNFLLVYFSYHVIAGTNSPANYPTALDIPESFAWTFLASATLLCLFSGSVAFHYVPETHKSSFYRHNTFKEHVATFWWNDKTHGTDLNLREITDRDEIRALIPLWCSEHYTPKAKLVAFYEEKWAGWCANPPDWFDDEFKADVPHDLLVEVDESLWAGGGEKN